jgi:hypothetical protein
LRRIGSGAIGAVGVRFLRAFTVGLVLASGTPASAGVGKAPAGSISIDAGTRVRVTAVAPTLVTTKTMGWFEEWDPDTLWVLRDPGRERIGIPAGSVRGLELSAGTKGDPVAGGILGFAVGTVVGVFVAAMVAEQDPSSHAEYAFATTLVGFTILGVVVGNHTKSERWKEWHRS